MAKWWQRDPNRDIDDEFAAHLELETERQVQQGVPPRDARDAAIRRFGNLTRYREDTLAVRGLVWWQHLRHDLRSATRAVARRPLASGAAIVALAFGMGGPAAFLGIVLSISTAVFPGVRNPRQLVMLSETAPREPGQRLDATPDTVRVWRANALQVQQLAAVQPSVVLSLRTADLPQNATVQPIGVDLLPLLGVSPAEGRAFDPRDDDLDAEPVALVSDTFVERRAEGRSNAVGSVLDLDGRQVTIVGVMPLGFWFGSRDVDVWVPIPERDANPAARYRVVARMNDGDDAGALAARLAALSGQVAAAQPAREAGWGVRVERIGRRPLFGGDLPPGVLMLIAAAVLGLLAACANIAMVMVARGVARQKETAVRSALGAGRGRLVLEFLAESVVVSMAGGAVALLIVFAAFRLMVASSPPDVSAAIDVALDWRIVAGVLAMALAVGVLSGLAPALSDSRVHLVAALKETGYFGGAPARSRVRRALIVIEITITLMMLANTALLIRGVIDLERTSVGFNPDNLLVLRLDPVQHVGRPASPPPEIDLLTERIAAVPGVESVAATRAALTFSPVNPVGETYFTTLGLRLVDGRAFTTADRNARVVIVSEAFARRRFGQGAAVGKTVQIGDETDAREIIGVVSDVWIGGFRREPNPCVYVPYATATRDRQATLTLLVRRAPGANVAGDIRRAVVAINPVQTIGAVRVLKDALAVGVEEVRVSVYLTAPILVLAMLLAMTGIYGLLAQTVAQRTHELAVRVALGAGRRDLLRLVVVQGLKLAAVGALVGSAAALALDRALGAFLFGVPTDQLLALVGAALLIIAITLVASVVPCRRALHIDPGKTLKYE